MGVMGCDCFPLPWLQRNTYQGILVTNGQRSYALFLYQCGQLQTNLAGVGYLADGNFYENHPLSNSDSSSDVACQNEPQSQWSNVIYQLDYRGWPIPAAAMH